MRKLSKKTFKNLAMLSLLLFVGAALYMIAADTGLFILFARLLADYGTLGGFLSLCLTVLSGLIAALACILVLRNFSDMPTLSEQLKKDAEMIKSGDFSEAKKEAGEAMKKEEEGDAPYFSVILSVLGACLGVVGIATLPVFEEAGKLFVFQIALILTGAVLFLRGLYHTVKFVLKKTRRDG